MKIDKELCARAGGYWLNGRCEGALCETCGSRGDFRGLSRSHIIAKSRRGKDTLENVIIQCYPCHELCEKKPELTKEMLRRNERRPY